MDKEKKEKDSKPRSEKYDAKLSVKGTFEQVIKAAFIKDKQPKK
ncbi:hypothetical protein ACFQ3S_11045 [Mucilaginibacter terrae]